MHKSVKFQKLSCYKAEYMRYGYFDAEASAFRDRLGV